MDETKIENQSEPNVSDNTQTQPVYTASKKNTKHVRGISDYVFIVLRALIILLVCSMFFAAFNPAYIFTKANGNSINNISSVFTAALSKSSIVVNDISNAITKGVLDAAPFTKLHVACIIIVLAIIVIGAAGCVSVGNNRMKHLSTKIAVGGGLLLLIGCFMVNSFYNGIEGMIHSSDSAETSYQVEMKNQTNKFTSTYLWDEASGTYVKSDYAYNDSAVYEIVITNNSGIDLVGWALEINVGSGYDINDVKKVNQWFSLQQLSRGETKYDYNVSYDEESGILYITPDDYEVKDGVLIKTTDAAVTDASTIKAGTLKITFIAENILEGAEVSVYDGAATATVEYAYPKGLTLYFVFAILIIVLAIALEFLTPRALPSEEYEMETQYQLFLMFLPFILLIFAFSYLPLYGWRYAFYQDANSPLTGDNYVGFYWFKTLFANSTRRTRFFRVMINTFAMSGLGLITSWLPMAFAIFLNEVKSTKFKRFVQTFSTIPNFISWVLIYGIAFALFNTNGLWNSVFGGTSNALQNPDHMWLKMLAWGTWKGIGWSAIIYISGIAGIDQQLYEAASIDGADRYQRMWHITLPGLLPTYVVMLVMQIAGILSNGMDQYLVFSNTFTSEPLEVLDLYVYKVAFEDNLVPLSTVVGMGKSVISIVLFFAANSAAKAIRGNGIV